MVNRSPVDLLLTVVVPVYAVEGYLYRCLESIRAGLTAEESAAVEVIAIDDDSPDRCGDMLDAYAARHGDLRVVHLPANRGLGLTRNAGLDAARGTYIWFVDSDDWLPAGSVRTVLASLREHLPDVLVVDHLRIHENGRAEVDASSHLLRGVPMPTRLADHPQLLRVQHTAWNKIIRRDYLDRLGLRFLPSWYEDVPFSHPVLIAADRIAVLDRVCYHYCVGRAGAITETRSERHFEVLDQYDRLYDWLESRRPEPWLRAAVFSLMVSHLLVVAGNDGRLHPRQRRAFFRRLVAHYRTYRPAGWLPPAGAQGMRHRLVGLGSYPLWSVARYMYRAAARLQLHGADGAPPVRHDLESTQQSDQRATTA
jgi:glycosyltransferase involved in cell wall biosynthesis